MPDPPQGAGDVSAAHFVVRVVTARAHMLRWKDLNLLRVQVHTSRMRTSSNLGIL